MKKMPIALLNWCVTFPFRWNSTYYLLESVQHLKPAIVRTLDNMEGDPPVEFMRKDWTLIDQVVDILEPFEDATKWLSYHDASISMVVPIVTSITESLKTSSADRGVITMKKALKDAMDARFGNVESNEHYTIATFLDAKYRGHFFMSDGVEEKTKTSVIEKLKEELRKQGDCEVSDWHSYL